MEDTTVTLQVLMDVNLGVDGIQGVLWIGDASDPSAEHVISWEDIIAREVEMYTIPGSNVAPFEDERDLYNMFDNVRVLRAVADEMEEQLMALRAFDRKAWLDANKGFFNGPHSKEDFCKPMKEYLDVDA